MRHKALILKVQDNNVAREFPFEKSYFFHETARAHIGRCFRYGLIAPIFPAIQKLFSRTIQGSDQDLKPCAIGKVHGIYRSSPELEEALTKREPALEILARPREHFMVIPILSIRAKIDVRRTVAYLSPHCATYIRTRHLASVSGLGSNAKAYPDWIYHKIIRKMSAIYEGRELTSFCLFCHRAVLGLAGRCVIGSIDCRKSMVFAGDGEFCENLALYHKSLMGYPDRLIPGDTNGSLQDNDNRSGGVLGPTHP